MYKCMCRLDKEENSIIEALVHPTKSCIKLLIHRQESFWCVLFRFTQWLFSYVLNYIFKHETHNIKSPYVILCRFPSCSQNSSDLSRHGHKTSGDVLWCLAPETSGPLCSWVQPTWIRFVLARPTCLNRLGSGEFEGKVTTWALFLHSLSCSWAVFTVYQGALSCWSSLLFTLPVGGFNVVAAECN